MEEAFSFGLEEGISMSMSEECSNPQSADNSCATEPQIIINPLKLEKEINPEEKYEDRINILKPPNYNDQRNPILNSPLPTLNRKFSYKEIIQANRKGEFGERLTAPVFPLDILNNMPLELGNNSIESIQIKEKNKLSSMNNTNANIHKGVTTSTAHDDDNNTILNRGLCSNNANCKCTIF